MRNYGTDPETTQLVDNLDIFIVPQINGDGSIHSLYDSNRRKNLSNYCTLAAAAARPTRCTTTAAQHGQLRGVDPRATATLRPQSGASILDGILSGATFDGLRCSGNYSGPVRDRPSPSPQRDVGPVDVPEHQVRNEHPLLRRLLHVAARRLHAGARAAALPAVRHAELLRPDGRAVLDGSNPTASTAILPQQTGPVIDVLYSAAGNSADEAYYSHGIIGYDFEIGASNTRHRQSRAPASSRATARSAAGVRHQHLQRHTSSTRATHEGMEFANGNYGAAALRAAVLQRHRGAGRRRGRDVRRQGHLLGQVQEQRGVLDLLHDRRLDADHGLDRVEAEPAARAAASAGPRARHDAEVDRQRLQGQHLGGQVPGARADRHARHASAAASRRRWP